MVHSGAILSVTFKTIKSEKKKTVHYQRLSWEYLHVNVASCKGLRPMFNV